METEYDVFISHAGEDKEALAVPIYEGLQRRGIRAFLDREELRTGNKAAAAMLNAVDGSAIGLCILSPEYGAKNWPMLELRRFLQNIEKTKTNHLCEKMLEPMLIPIFYRMGVSDCKDRLLFSKYPQLLRRKDLLERLGSGETSHKQILDNLEELSKRTGIENKAEVTNENTEYNESKRERFVEHVCEKVSRALRDFQRKRESSSATHKHVRQDDDVFQAEFYVPENPVEVRLDFSSSLKSNLPLTPEAEVMRKVLCRDEKSGQNRVVVIKGIGVGKSCTLRGLGREKEVQRRFPGGVYFISLGKDATVSTLIGELLKILRLSGGQKLAQKLLQEKDLDVILARVGKWMNGKRILVLVDDLWDRKSLGASIISRLVGTVDGEKGSIVVVTSRFSSVGSMGTMVEIKTREPTSREARRILLGYASLSEAEVQEWNLEDSLEELMRIGGGLPVCLAAMGRGIGELMQHCGEDKGLALQKYLRVISKKRENLVEMGVDSYSDLRTTLSASLEVLEESRKLAAQSWCKWSYAELHRSLCVFQKPVVAPLSVVCRLWEVEKEDGWMIVKGFADVGLASIEVSSEDQLDCIRLHDLIHDFALGCANVENESRIWHRRLLEGYFSIGGVKGVEEQVREWWKIEDEYMLRMLSWHLVCAERVDELVLLLLRCEWTEVRSKRGGVLAMKKDFSECLNGLKRSKTFGAEKDVVQEALCVIHDAMLESWGFTQGNWNEIGFQMWGRLGGKKGRYVRKYLECIEKHLVGPWLKPLKPLKQNWAEKNENGLDGEIVLDGFVECITPTGRSSYAVGAGNEVVVYDVNNKKVMGRCKGNGKDVLAVGARKESESVVFCCEDGTVIDWNMKSEEVERRTVLSEWEKGEGYSEMLGCAAFDLNVTFIVTCCLNGEKVKMWDVNTGELLGNVELNCSAVQHHSIGFGNLEVSKCGKYVACGTICGVQVWDVSLKTQFTDMMHCEEEELWFVSFHPSNAIVASAGQGRIRIFDVCTGDVYAIIDYSCLGYCECIAFDGDGQRVAAGVSSGDVYVWNIETQRVECRYSARSPIWVCSLQFEVSSDVLLFGSDDKMLRVWNMSTHLDFADDDSNHPREKITCISISPDGSFYVSGCSNGMVVIWDSNEQEPRGDALEHDEEVWCIAISSDSQLVGSGAVDGNIRIWDANTCEQTREPFCGHSGKVESIAFSPDGRFIMSCATFEDVRIWSIGEGKQIGRVIPGVYNMGSSLLASGIVEVGKAIKRKCKGEGFFETWMRQPCDGPRSAAITPDGKRVISSWCSWEDGSILEDTRVSMWELETGKFICQEPGPKFGAERIKFTQSNCVMLYTALSMPFYWHLDGEKGIVRVQDNERQDKIPYFQHEQYAGNCNEIACTHDGRYLRWRADGRRLGTLPVRAFEDAWVYDSSREVIVIGGDDGNVYFYKLVK